MTPFKEMGSSPVKQVVPIIKTGIKLGIKGAKYIKNIFSKSKKVASKTKQHYKVRNPDKSGRGFVDIMSGRTAQGGKSTGFFGYRINPTTGKFQFDATRKMAGGKDLKNVDAIVKNINKGNY